MTRFTPFFATVRGWMTRRTTFLRRVTVEEPVPLRCFITTWPRSSLLLLVPRIVQRGEGQRSSVVWPEEPVPLRCFITTWPRSSLLLSVPRIVQRGEEQRSSVVWPEEPVPLRCSVKVCYWSSSERGSVWVASERSQVRALLRPQVKGTTTRRSLSLPPFGE